MKGSLFAIAIGAAAFGLGAAGVRALAQDGGPSAEDGRKAFRAACIHCHGSGLPEQVAALSFEDFAHIVLNGKGSMPAFKKNATVSSQIEAIYAYLAESSGSGSPAKP